MSRASLEKSDKPQELSDDLEAFFHVLLYHVLRYRTASKQLRLLQGRMQEIFDESVQDEKGFFHGGGGKLHFFRMGFFDAEDIAAILPAPLAGLIEELRDIFNVFYWPKTRRAGPSPEAREAAREKLRSSAYSLALFKAHLNLDGWLHDDPAVDVLPQLLRRNKRTWRM
ncbi:hypothetical protein EWM64_g4184 [Hericium alpestre]|uniref:Uncharacterized protein n=1 Tax=Hericium alpestre TaxID=135208 RepID=A0A4Y9ZYC7_9AGAM|nr:hypothetical protein EWM64_g4184 [Hericium alpestre]